MKTIGFIGLGLIGGSIAKTIRKFHPDYHILAYAKHKETLAAALNCGAKPAQCGTSSSDHGAYDFPGSFSSGSLQCSISSWKEMVSR